MPVAIFEAMKVDTAFKDEKVVEVVDGKVMRRKTK